MNYILQHWRRYAFVITLLASILSLAIGQPRANADPFVPPATPEALAPDGAVVAPFSLAPLPAVAFPATDTMTETVEAVVEQLNQLPQPIMPPTGTLLAQSLSEQGMTAQSHARHVFIPMSRVVRPTSSPSPQPSPLPGDVAVTLWPTPSIRVMRDATLSYEVRITNHGQGNVAGVQVKLPYNRQQTTLIGTQFVAGSGDWVSNIGTDTITVNFGPLAPGAKRTGKLNYRVASTLANNTVISMRATASWSDDRTGGNGATNWVPVLVGTGTADSAYTWLSVSPASGKAGTMHQFFTDRFIPGEGVVTWLNTPSGVKPLDLRGTADTYGRVTLNFSSTGLAAGNYALVAYGARSGLTAVAGFTVSP